jgi:hypothetical protein
VPEYLKNVARGIGFGVAFATLLTLWVTFLRSVGGPGAFERNQTTYEDVVRVYYAAGLLGGAIVGVLWPFRRSIIGAAIVGVLAIFPMYFGFSMQQAPRAEWFTADSLVANAFISSIVGGSVGIGFWLKENPRGPRWVDTLRYPAAETVRLLWVTAVVGTVVGWTIGIVWAGKWIAIVGFTIFIAPVAFAIGVSIVYDRRSSRAKGKN